MPKQMISDKQATFINNYCTNGHNVSKAYAEAYPDSNSKASESNGIRLIRNDKIKKAIQAFMDESKEVCKLTAESIITRLQQLSGLAPLKGDDTVLPATTDAGQIRSLDLLGKHLKLWDRAGEDTEDDQATKLSKEALSALRLAASTVNKQSVSKPTLYEHREQA